MQLWNINRGHDATGEPHGRMRSSWFMLPATCPPPLLKFWNQDYCTVQTVYSVVTFVIHVVSFSYTHNLIRKQELSRIPLASEANQHAVNCVYLQQQSADQENNDWRIPESRINMRVLQYNRWQFPWKKWHLNKWFWIFHSALLSSSSIHIRSFQLKHKPKETNWNFFKWMGISSSRACKSIHIYDYVLILFIWCYPFHFFKRQIKLKAFKKLCLCWGNMATDSHYILSTRLLQTSDTKVTFLFSSLQ